VLEGLVDLVLPPRCGGCHLPGSWLCDICRRRIRRLEEPLCRRCGAELDSARASCGCKGRLRALARLRSAVAYEGPVESAVHRFKYQGWRRLAAPLAQLLAERLVIEGLASSMVVAVPLHPDRHRQRGFNQAELLARELRQRLELGKPTGRLLRVRATIPQVGNDRLHRWQNVRDAFAWRGPALDGSPLMLVDDVATTGATLEACATALKSAGAGPVIGVTVARVRL
jgi:competence protein ComFC